MTQQPYSPIRQPGFWLVLLLAAVQLMNALRAVLDPNAFAGYLGLPLSDPTDQGWVAIYALRTFFIGSFALYLLLNRQIRSLSALALLALVMPIGDLWLVHQAHASTATLARHAVIGSVLLVTFYFLRRWSVELDNSRKP